MNWEVEIRQAGSLCEYGRLTVMCRDMFVFGLNDTVIHIELLNTHLRAGGTTKTCLMS